MAGYLEYDAKVMDEAADAFERMAELHANIAMDCKFALYATHENKHAEMARRAADCAAAARLMAVEARAMLPIPESKEMWRVEYPVCVCPSSDEWKTAAQYAPSKSSADALAAQLGGRVTGFRR